MGAGNFVSNNCRVIPMRLTVTTPVVVYTAGQRFTHIVGVRIVNWHTSASPLINFIYKPIADGVSYFYQANYTLAVGSALWFPFDAFGIYQNDQLIVQSSVANAVDVFVLIAEIPGRNQ